MRASCLLLFQIPWHQPPQQVNIQNVLNYRFFFLSRKMKYFSCWRELILLERLSCVVFPVHRHFHFQKKQASMKTCVFYVAAAMACTMQGLGNNVKEGVICRGVTYVRRERNICGVKTSEGLLSSQNASPPLTCYPPPWMSPPSDLTPSIDVTFLCWGWSIQWGVACWVVGVGYFHREVACSVGSGTSLGLTLFLS